MILLPRKLMLYPPGILCILLMAPREMLFCARVQKPGSATGTQVGSLLVPVGLHADPLLGEVLTAPAYPTEAVEPRRWMQQNRSLQGQAFLKADGDGYASLGVGIGAWVNTPGTTPPLTPVESSAPQLGPYTKSPSATKRIQTSVGDFGLWVDEAKWKQDQDNVNTPGELHFSNVNGEAWAIVITDRFGVPNDGLREVALINAKRVDPNARITFEENRIVNGRQVLALQMAFTTKGVPLRYVGYYHGGTSGSIQVIAFTREPALTYNIEDLTEFLNGLEFSDQDLPAAANSGLVSFNSKMSVKYDPKKWKPLPSNEPGTFTFIYSMGDACAIVIAEPVIIPPDELTKIALSNAQSEDPNAKVVFKERRTVNGQDVWFMKMESEVSKVPLTFLGYYLSNDAGTVQLVTFSNRTMIGKYEKDFMEFLNGLSGSE
jgi:hypothetical protein